MRSVFLLFGLLVACKAPPLAMSGSVASACDAKPAPLANANVTIKCPDEAAPRYSRVTDARGHFEILLGAALRPNCNVEIAHEGYATRTYTVGEICGMREREGRHEDPTTPCAFGGVTAELSPAVKP